MQIGHWFRYFFVVCCFWLLSAILDFCSFWLRFSHLWLTSYVPSLDAQLTDEVDFHPITSTPVKRGATVSLRGSIHLPQVLSLQLSRGARGIKAQSKKMKKMNWEVQVISNYFFSLDKEVDINFLDIFSLLIAFRLCYFLWSIFSLSILQIVRSNVWETIIY